VLESGILDEVSPLSGFETMAMTSSSVCAKHSAAQKLWRARFAVFCDAR
jgi:hypothetical protein